MQATRALVLLCGLAVGLPVSVFGAIMWERWGAVQARAERQTLATTAMIEQSARHVFETQELVLDLVADLVGTDTDAMIHASGVSARLTELADRLPQTVSVWVSNAGGDVVASSVPPAPGINATGLDYFEVHRDAGVPRYMGRPYIGRTTQLPSFAMSRRRPSQDGSFVGVLHVAISPTHFEEAFALAIGMQGGAAALLRSDGVMLARYPARTELGHLPPESPLLRAIAAAPQSGLIRDRSSLDGVPRLYAYRLLEPFGVYVGYGVDLPQRIAAWWAAFVRDAVLTGLAILLLLSSIFLVWRGQRARAVAALALEREIQQRATLEAELAESRAMEALGRMARGVAHDFNNLLTVVLGNLEALEELLPDEAQRNISGRARRAAESGAQLASSLLAYARTQVLSLEPVAIAQLLQDMLPMLQDMAGKRAQVSLRIAPDLPFCLCDATQIRAALGNLVTNARDAMAATPGQIAIHADARDLTAEDLAGTSARPGRFVSVTVADNGLGMSADVVARAFAPFFTTKAGAGGSGLGLSHVYGLVTQLGGRVGLTSEAGLGTQVVLDLPAVDAPPASAEAAVIAQGVAPAAACAVAPVVAMAPRRILLVDDQVEIRAIADRILTRAGYEVVAASSPREALTLVDRGLRVDLLLSDVVMPGDLDGVTLIGKLRQIQPALPAVLMSGYTPDAPALLAAGAGFIAKPFTRRALLDAVTAAIG